MPANLENSAVATGLKKVSFYSNLKEGQCQRMFKLPYNCAHLTCQQGKAQNSSSEASAVHEWRTSSCASYVKKRWRQYTEELYKNDLNDLDNHYGVVNHLDPVIMECEVK